MAFSIEIKELRGSVVFLLKGKLIDENDSLQLKEKVAAEMEKGVFQIVFDLSHLENCNSSGLNVFIRTLTKTRTHQGDSVICAVNPSLEKLFAITKLNEIFSLYPTQKEALTHFKNT